MAIMLPNYPEFDSDQTIGTREEIDKWLFAIRLFGEFALLLQDGHLATGLGPGHTGIHDFEMPEGSIITGLGSRVTALAPPDDDVYWLMSTAEGPRWVNRDAFWRSFGLALRSALRDD